MELVLANREMKRVVDVRSDTVTRPTDAMQAAMAEAQVDGDVLGSDPTTAKLQKQMAKIMGKEATLFMPSGTMGNLISVLVHCEEGGSEVIVGSISRIHVYENGGISTIGHAYPHLVENEADGTMDMKKVEAAIRPPGDDDMYYATTRLICIENTHAKFLWRASWLDLVAVLLARNILQQIDGI